MNVPVAELENLPDIDGKVVRISRLKLTNRVSRRYISTRGDFARTGF